MKKVWPKMELLFMNQVNLKVEINTQVENWIKFANSSLKVAYHNHYGDENHPLLDYAANSCFEAVEKYLKAYLVANKIEIDKRFRFYNLTRLLEHCKIIDSEFHFLDSSCLLLQPFTSAVRYPTNIDFTFDFLRMLYSETQRVCSFIDEKIKNLKL